MSCPAVPRGLARIRETAPQSTLGLGQRADNVRGAFAAVDEVVAGRHVLLVDDVLTTGATAESCAKALGQGGAESVTVLTVARVV